MDSSATYGFRDFSTVFSLTARLGRSLRTLPGDGPVISVAGVDPDVLDPETGQKRLADTADIARMAHLANELPGIDTIVVPILANDIPDEQFNLNRFCLAAKNCMKPIRFSAKTSGVTDDLVRMAEIIAGGNYITHEHTFKHMRTAAYLPTIANRQSWLDWENAGRPDSLAGVGDEARVGNIG